MQRPDVSISDKTILKILNHYKSIWGLAHLSKLSEWDSETMMPTQGAALRGDALGINSVLQQRLMLDKPFVKLVADAGQITELNIYEKAIVRVLAKQIEQAKKLPEEFIEEFAQTVSTSQIAWRKAKAGKSYAEFKPYLAKIVNLTRRKAEYLGYTDHPYTALVDEYEEGQTKTNLDEYFAKILPFLKKLLSRLSNSSNFGKPHALEQESYKLKSGEMLNEQILTYLNIEADRMRLDTSSHPFTQSISRDDVRITTRYHSADITRSIMGTIHEYGHGLYELQSHHLLEKTPIGGGLSLGIHESQSRFWENIVGRSKSFVEAITPNLQLLGSNFAEYSANDFYTYLNQVKPSLLRVEADELTYHFHIYIRYQLELALINGELSADDLPSAWNQMYKEHLNIDVPNDAEGVLQDIHWSMGAIGYFTTYSTGTVLSHIIADKLSNSLDLTTSAGNTTGIGQIKQWLLTNIHQYGATFTFNELITDLSGQFTAQPWQNYLTSKYTDIYS